MEYIQDTLFNFKEIIKQTEKHNSEKVGNLILDYIFIYYRVFFYDPVKLETGLNFQIKEISDIFTEVSKNELKANISDSKDFRINIVNKEKRKELHNPNYTKVCFYNKSFDKKNTTFSFSESYHTHCSFHSLLKFCEKYQIKI